MTRISAEICFLARLSEHKVGEHTSRLEVRRLADLDPEAIVAEYGSAARNIALAGAPPTWEGPVVLVGEAAADFLGIISSPLWHHAGSRSVHEKTSRFNAGKPVHSGELQGEPLNVTSDPLVAFGIRSGPQSSASARRSVTLAREGRWDGLLGDRRYHHYLGLLGQGILPPGPAGNTTMPAGPTPMDDLASSGIVVRAFSAFEVDDASGQFSVEIRLGETREGDRAEPFTGGLLVGNWFEVMGNANYSSETQVNGSFYGPKAVRLNKVKVAG
jgi:predicted Zn-dependent protease